MIPVLTAAEMRALDERAIGQVGVPGAVLMETAGRGVFEHLWRRYGDRAQAGPVAVVCGRGNNGGDGFVVARCLANRGCRVTAYLLGARERVGGDAAVHLGAFLGGGGQLVELGAAGAPSPADAVRGAALVVDAVFGTGLGADVRGPAAEAIEAINHAGSDGTPVVSVDIPSGVCADTGRVRGVGVRADLTVTFAFPKRGHFLHPGAGRVGRLEVVDIGIPPLLAEEAGAGLRLAEEADFAGKLARAPDAHKGTLGHVVVFAGSPGKAGAAGLAGWAALRAGAGLATVAWPAGTGGENRLPLEVMTEPLAGPGGSPDGWTGALWPAAAELASRAAAVVVGPGMGTGAGVEAFLDALLHTPGAPAVVDADGLNAVAAAPGLWEGRRRDATLTPHPGEAARLLGSTTSAVQADRVGAARALAERFDCPVILKGAGTLIAAPGSPGAGPTLIPRGNPGMATAGSGDVLSGVVGALLARGMGPAEAAVLGAWVHAVAGDLAAERLGVEGMTATDLIVALPSALQTLAAP